ncbi:MAG TPA: UpxY family transcription antiterminator [Terriglobales bacterium]|nr:UpxY family transcription antiterminator [Terriglobales bacterium]
MAELSLGDELALTSAISSDEFLGSQGPGQVVRNADPLQAPRWYAVSVCPRREKVVTAHLEKRGLTCFLPVYRSVRRWKDRRKELDMVLFPGYVFVNLNLRDRMCVLQAPGTLRFVTFGGHPVPVQDSELRPLALSMTAGLRAEPHPYLRQGRRVRVVRGPLANTEGILVRRKERFRLVLSVDLIMRSVMLEVDESEVESC